MGTCFFAQLSVWLRVGIPQPPAGHMVGSFSDTARKAPIMYTLWDSWGSPRAPGQGWRLTCSPPVQQEQWLPHPGSHQRSIFLMEKKMWYREHISPTKGKYCSANFHLAQHELHAQGMNFSLWGAVSQGWRPLPGFPSQGPFHGNEFLTSSLNFSNGLRINFHSDFSS